MKSFLYTLGFILVLISILYAIVVYSDMKKYRSLYERERQNVEAYAVDNSKEDRVYQYQMTIDELRNSKDSINQMLVQVTESLKIKPKNIHTIEYQTAIIEKTDTIEIKGDTIFKDNTVNVDTIIGDQWYDLRLQCTYPSTIVTTPSFRSEKYVIVNTKKEYNRPRSKWFFIRWFQKKHTVISVDVVEKNPYIENSDQRFINIVK